MKSPFSIQEAMRIKVEAGGSREELEMPENASSMDLLARLGLLPDAHLVLRDGTPIPIDERLNDEDRLKVIKVASGG